MTLLTPITSLKLDLAMIEIELKKYTPPICKYDNIYKHLLEIRKEYKEAIKKLSE